MKRGGIERRLAGEPRIVGRVFQLPDSSGLVVANLGGGTTVVLDEQHWTTGELGIRDRSAAEQDLERRVLLSRDRELESRTALLLGRRTVEKSNGSRVAYFEVLEGLKEKV